MRHPFTPGCARRPSARRLLPTTVAGGALALAAAFASTPVAAQDVRAAEVGGFIVRYGGDTVGVERYTRTADSLTGEVALRGGLVRRASQPTYLRYAAALGEDGSVLSIRMEVWQANAAAGLDVASDPARTGLLRFAHDTVLVQVNAAAARSTRVASWPDAIPFSNIVVAHLEQTLHRARALGGESVKVPMFLTDNNITIPAGVTWLSADSALLRVADEAIRLRIDGEGRILTAIDPVSGLYIERVWDPTMADVAGFRDELARVSADADRVRTAAMRRPEEP